MWRCAGDHRAFPGFNGVSSSEQQALEERLLAKILSDHESRFSSSDKARALIAAHCDLAGVLRTESRRLKLVVPLSDEEVGLLDVMRRAAGFAPDNDVLSRPTIGSLSALEAYLGSSVEIDLIPNLRALLLDQHNRLLADIPLKDRAEQEAVAHNLIQTTLEYGASAAIVVQSDNEAEALSEAALIKRAKIVEQSLQVVDIVLHDYVRQNSRGWLSMRASGLLR